MPFSKEHEALEIDRQKQQALSILGDVWDQASDDGMNIDCLSHAALFQALSSLVLAYGEESVAKFCNDLPNRIMCGDYSLERKLQ
ncbi:hypothetical protein C0081_08970 [Cohaesibacter celericrescens]|uniref:Uncharacterized protein n=1 Tax=Cohaesibacter celericrescens TaxID=2067669 RepID=A0A2N5XTC0_9HYPH|nr:hypothetical protein C0081_08970 [Cohaesibacter celericrescens]